MLVCEECHEIDKDVIGCTKELTRHSKHYFGLVRKSCGICGKDHPSLFICHAYDERMKDVSKRDQK